MDTRKFVPVLSNNTLNLLRHSRIKTDDDNSRVLINTKIDTKGGVESNTISLDNFKFKRLDGFGSSVNNQNSCSVLFYRSKLLGVKGVYRTITF